MSLAIWRATPYCHANVAQLRPSLSKTRGVASRWRYGVCLSRAEGHPAVTDPRFPPTPFPPNKRIPNCAIKIGGSRNGGFQKGGLADVPWTPKTGTRVQKRNDATKNRNEDTFAKNHPFTKPPKIVSSRSVNDLVNLFLIKN